MFGVSLFTVFDISYIGQLLVFSMILSSIIWENYSFDQFNFKIENIITFSILTLTIVNLFYPTKFLSKLMKFTTGGVTSVKVFTESHITGLFVYKFKKNGKNIYMAFNKHGLFHKSQLFTSRYKQAAMYKVTDYCLGKKNEEDIIDLAYLSGKGKTVILGVKKFNPSKSYQFFKYDKWYDILEISFNKDTYRIKNLSTPPKIDSLRINNFLIK